MTSPHFKHGRYAKILPVQFAAAYEQARTDADLLALRDEAAIVQARIGELLMRFDVGDAAAGDAVIWAEVQARIEAARKVSEAERTRVIDMPATVTADEAMAFSSALVAVAQQHVTDQATFAKIQGDMQRIFEEPNSHVA